MKLISSPLIKSQNPSRLGRGHWSSNSNAGQAVLEYILMVVVGVTLVVSLSVAIFQPLGQFVDNLNREYIKCLLETGELPQLSSEDQNVVCFDEIPSFVALDAEGNPLAPGGAGQGGGNQRAESAANRDGQTTESNGGRTVRSNYRGGGRRSSNSSRAGSERGASKTTVIAVNQEFEEGGGFFSSQSGSGRGSARRKKTRKVALSSLTEYDRQKVERSLEKSKSTPVSSDEGITQARKKKVLVKPPSEKKVLAEISVPVGYGHYLKIFIIIILILFIIIVFGSQAYQMSKNWGNS